MWKRLYGMAMSSVTAGDYLCSSVAGTRGKKHIPSGVKAGNYLVLRELHLQQRL